MITSIITRVNTFRNRFLLINYGTKRPDNFSPERLTALASQSVSLASPLSLSASSPGKKRVE